MIRFNIYLTNGPRVGKTYDPRSLEDKARRTFAYLLVALLARMIVPLLAAVVFAIIPFDEIKEFGAILGPLMALVSAATGFYYATKRRAIAATTRSRHRHMPLNHPSGAGRLRTAPPRSAPTTNERAVGLPSPRHFAGSLPGKYRV